MLTIAEEVLLLVLDDETGRVNPRLPVHSLRNAVSGALLMDLAFSDRIDTDLHQLHVVDSTPLGEPVLDPALARVVGEKERQPTVTGSGSSRPSSIPFSRASSTDWYPAAFSDARTIGCFGCWVRAATLRWTDVRCARSNAGSWTFC